MPHCMPTLVSHVKILFSLSLKQGESFESFKVYKSVPLLGMYISAYVFDSAYVFGRVT